jgi:hypothetical protein
MMVVYPKLFRLRQTFQRPRVEDVPAEVRRQLAKLGLDKKIRPGERVAITAGSRGIANIDRILQTVVQVLRQSGAEPFIFPAMGSHGGGTAEGQQKIIDGYGITEARCGCPIRSSLETVVVGQAAEGFPIHADRYAFEADHVLLCGRIKPHTQFAGPIQSGLLKMLLIGLGKYAGAQIYHRAFQDHGFQQIVRSVAGRLLEACHVVGGLAVVENADDATAEIAGVAPQEIFEREAELLTRAWQLLPRLPFRTADVLIVDELGKDISGAGMDTNVVGRKQYADPAGGETAVRVKRIIARGLTAASHGNATGIGLADFCTERIVAQMDQRATWINGMTAGHLDAVKTPPSFATDRAILDAALTTIGLTPPAQARLQWIRNTRDLTQVECSVAYLDEARGRDDLEVITEAREMPLDAAGHLPPTMGSLT